MKNFLIVLLLLPVFARAQTDVTITLPMTIVTEDRLKKVNDRVDSLIFVIKTTPAVPPVIPPVIPPIDTVIIPPVDSVQLADKVNDYKRRIFEANGSIDDKTLGFIDKFWKAIISSGAAANLDEVGVFAGTNLAASLVKFIAGTGSASAIANMGFVAVDYAQGKGFGMLGINKGKTLHSGFFPAAAGINYKNVSAGLVVLEPGDITTSDLGQPQMGLNPTIPALDRGFALGYSSTSLGEFYTGTPKYGWSVTSIRSDSTMVNYSYEGIPHGYRLHLNNPLKSQDNFNAELTFFGDLKWYGKPSPYSKGRIGGYYIGRSMTMEQQSAIDRAFMQLNIDLGRVSAKPVDVFFGDSNTAGWGTGVDIRGSNTFVAVAEKGLGTRAVNAGTPSSQLRLNTANGNAQFSGLNKLPFVLALKPSRVFITYGENDINFNDADVKNYPAGNPVLIDLYKQALTSAVQQIKASGSTPVINSLPFFQQASLRKKDAYMVVQKQVATEHGVKFIDIHTPTNGKGDAFHLTAAGHIIAGNTIASAMKVVAAKKLTAKK